VRLHWSPRSPFVRKVMIAAQVAGLADRIECVRSLAAATKPNPEIMRDNPLSKIPTLVLDDGSALYDSPVICEYFDGLHDGPKLFPAGGPARLTALRRQALGDGLLDVLLLWRGEQLRPEARQSPDHLAAFEAKTWAALDALEREAPDLAKSAFNIGHIAIGCALGYLDFRFPELDWRAGRPQLADWQRSFEALEAVRAVPVVDDY
jgi:glutathione S-transferase